MKRVCHWFLPIDWYNWYQSNQIYRYLSIYRLTNWYRFLLIDYSGLAANLRWHKMHEKDVLGIVTFDLIGVLPTNHVQYCLKKYYNGIPEFRGKCLVLPVKSSNNAKDLKFYRPKFKPTKNYGQLRWLALRFQTLICRWGDMVQNLESTRLSVRVDSPMIENGFWGSPSLIRVSFLSLLAFYSCCDPLIGCSYYIS